MAPEPLARASATRRRRAIEHAEGAVRELADQDLPVTFQAVARAAGVSRQWLYTQPELRARIEELRDTRRRTGSPRVPHGERAREESLRQRHETLLDDNRRLRSDNQRLRDELAILYGQRRDADAR